jgi:hypothetical protein
MSQIAILVFKIGHAIFVAHVLIAFKIVVHIRIFGTVITNEILEWLSSSFLGQSLINLFIG